MKCDVCQTEDTATNPVHSISNVREFDTVEYVCSNCVSMYDGTFRWNEDGRVEFV